MKFEEWKAQLALALERQFGWGAGEGLTYMTDEAEETWRDAFDNGLTPEEMAGLEFTGLVTNEGNK